MCSVTRMASALLCWHRSRSADHMEAVTTQITAGVVKLGQCYSGLIHKPTSDSKKLGGVYAHPEVLMRLAIATPRAFDHLNQDTLLLQALSESIKTNGSINPSIIRGRWLWPKLFEGRKGWTTFGIRFFDPPAKETPLFIEANKILQSTSTGIHRALYMAVHGVVSFGINEVPDEIYTAALGRLFRLFKDTKHEKLRILTISRGQIFDKIEENDRGEIHIILSYGQLQKEPYRAYPDLKIKYPRLEEIHGEWTLVYD